MAFTSFHFLLFFPAVILLYFLIPKSFRTLFLLTVSYFFYLNLNPVFVFLLAGITLSTYWFTIWIDNTQTEKKKRILFRGAIITSLFPLLFFKYFPFLNNEVIKALEFLGIRCSLPNISFLIPIGLSFYTFAAIGYIFDVYVGEIKAEKNFGIVALFLSFFPLVTSGPIERANHMFGQFKKGGEFIYPKAVKGVQLMLWGYFLKLVIADQIAVYLTVTFSNIYAFSGTTLLLATLICPVQVYTDLAGYSLIAIGCANVMGFEVMQNFNRPFFATSMSELWRRWHISFISWLTDYVFIPLCFKLRRFRIWGIVSALMITFFLSGLWHGADLSPIIWGVFQGLLLSIEALTKTKRNTLESKYKLGQKWWYNFSWRIIIYLLFSFSFLLSRDLGSVSNLIYVLHKIFTDHGTLFTGHQILVFSLLYSLFGIALLLLSEARDEFFPDKFLLFANNNVIIRRSSYLMIIILILMMGVFTGGTFIYFQY